MNGRNWYAVYTKPQAERKVAALLSKKKIESFCPHNRVVTGAGNKRKMVYEPLFPNFVFVHAAEKEVEEIKRTNDVLSFVYWLGKPAIIKLSEIEDIARFNGKYHNIKLEKVPVNPTGIPHQSDNPEMVDANNIEIKTARVRLMLPSLGFAMLAETVDNAAAGYAEKNTQTIA